MKDFTGVVPRSSAGKAGEAPLVVVRIPFTEAFSQDVKGKTMGLELTKEIRLAVHAPDANRYRWRPLGLPSGVKVAAITLERSPLQMEVNPANLGGLFEQPAKPVYKVKLHNITDSAQKFDLTFAPKDGKEHTVKGEVPAGQTLEQDVPLPDEALGYHPLTITLANNGKTLFSRKTAFGILVKNNRPYHDESPIGTWTFGGTHGTLEEKFAGPLFQQLGLRYGMFCADSEMRAKYGVRQGIEVALSNAPAAKDLERYEATLAKQPDLLPQLLIFHETGISGAHASRVPDLFVDRPAYVMNDAEKKSFAKLTQQATDLTKLFREKHPEVKILLGNGNLPLREEFYRNKFPAELFDAAGNEAGAFMRPPEAQPPDVVANNASIWMDRQMLDAYGYKDKAISECLEVIYPGSNPGNLSLQTQADYYIRNILHSMVWGMPQIRIGLISDTGNSYYYSNWGATGFFTRYPDVTPKPSALAIATLTNVLDGAKYDGFIETGSDSAYLLRFKKKNNTNVLVYWVVRGSRDYTLTLSAAKDVLAVQEMGDEKNLTVQDGKVTVNATSSPAYLEIPEGASCQSVALGAPFYNNKPDGKISKLSSLGSMDGWKVEKARNPGLEFYNPIEPRRQGKFSFEPVTTFEGRGPALCVKALPVTGGKPTMPMYAELASEKGIPMPGQPTEIGLWVNGNSAWGRIIYELEDASGQKWISIGAKALENSPWMADWLTPEMQKQFKPGDQADWNTDDAFGVSRINFDGWRYLAFPLPGQYPGEGYHWPANSQWHSDKDGVVHYPLTLKKIIVQLPEKTLYLQRFEAAKRPEIYLNDLISVEGNPARHQVKKSSD
ncbi:MAG: hypothetical protein ABI254_06510, partial [Chthoniobacterales bacterium]